MLLSLSTSSILDSAVTVVAAEGSMFKSVFDLLSVANMSVEETVREE